MGATYSPAVCIIVENESVPYDRRVWLEARSLVDRGYKVSVICPFGLIDRQRREIREGVDIYRYWTPRARGQFGHILEYLWALVAQLYLALAVYEKTRFQILQACNPPDTTFLIALIFKLHGVRFLFDHHDLSPELYLSRYGQRGVIYRLVCFAEWLSFQTADMCLTTNESFREIALTRGGVRPDRVAVVQTCADLRHVQPPPSDSAWKRGFPHLVVYVGQMEPQDGVELLLRSIRHIVHARHRHDILFVLIGDGSELRRLKALADRWKLNGNIEFTGRIPHDQVGPYLAAADACVAPDPLNPLNDHCSMIKIFEYMAYGKPTVLFDLKEGRRTTSGAALYACPNDTADFGEQVIKLLQSPSLRQELGACARRRVENDLNWEVQSKKLLAVFEALLLESAVPSPETSAEVRRLH